jgi:hypothetical protein
MIYTMNHEIKPFTQALLTKSELAWLVGKIQISKVYEYRIKSDIKKKLQTFQQIELPLLMEKGFIFPSNNNHLSVYTQNLSANLQLHESTKEGFDPGTFALPRTNSMIETVAAAPAPNPAQGHHHHLSHNNC